MRENRLIKGWKSFVVFCLAMVMTLGYAIPTGVSFAAGTEVAYSCGNNMDDQKVDGEPAYCVNKGREFNSTPGTNYDGTPRNTNVRVKYEWNDAPTAFDRSYSSALALALLANEYDNSGNPIPETGYGGFGDNQFRTKDVTPDQTTCADLLAKVLYYGYPNNADNTTFDKKATQEAVYWVIYQGKNGNTEGGNELVNKALQADIPADYKLYVYVLKDEDWSKNGAQAPVYWEQNVINAKFTTTSGPSIKTQVKTNEIANKKGQKITDTVTYENLEVGKTYTLTGKLINKATEKEVSCTVTPKQFTATEANGSVDVEFTNVDASTLNDGDKIVVYEYLHEGESTDSEPKAKHIDLNDDKQTVKVSSSAITISLSTKVVNQYISPAANQSFTDTVTFEGLEEGKTYTIKGVVKNQKDGSDVVAECEPLEVTADLDEAGMQFYGIDASGFKDGDKLVVFEYLYEGSAEETKDFKPGDGKEVASHTDINDEAQTVTIVDGQIKLEKKTNVTSAKPGAVIPYTITVTNERKVPATVQIVDNPDTGLSYVEASDNGVYDSDVNTVVWNDLEVPANGSVSVKVSFSIEEDASGKVTNRAHVFEPENSENVLGTYEDDSDVKVLGAYDDDARGAKTGDDAPIGLAVVGLLSAALALDLMRRRRMSN